MDNNLQKYLFWAFTHIPLMNTILQTTLIQIKPSGCTTTVWSNTHRGWTLMLLARWTLKSEFTSLYFAQNNPHKCTHSSMPTFSRSIPFYSYSRLFGSCFFPFHNICPAALSQTSQMQISLHAHRHTFSLKRTNTYSFAIKGILCLHRVNIKV